MHNQNANFTIITGHALNNSPLGLAAYLMEKFSTWTNPAFREKNDGGLKEKFTLDELLDNVMIYWVTGSITSSMRYYAENINSEAFSSGVLR